MISQEGSFGASIAAKKAGIQIRNYQRIVVRNRQKHIQADIANRAALFYNADTLNKEILKRKQKLLGL